MLIILKRIIKKKNNLGVNKSNLTSTTDMKEILISVENILLTRWRLVMKSGIMNVGDVMNKSLISVEKDDTIRLAIKKMVHGEFGAVVVTENGKPIGILTERDILKSIANEMMEPENKVEIIMSTPLIAVNSSASLGEAAEVMLTNNIRRLMVKENDEYVGIISQRELQRFITESK
jgi:CBS domain-containing protein